VVEEYYVYYRTHYIIGDADCGCPRVDAIDIADAADVGAERPAPKRMRLPSGQ
jgi:hypothetical protein